MNLSILPVYYKEVAVAYGSYLVHCLRSGAGATQRGWIIFTVIHFLPSSNAHMINIWIWNLITHCPAEKFLILVYKVWMSSNQMIVVHEIQELSYWNTSLSNKIFTTIVQYCQDVLLESRRVIVGLIATKK